MNETEPRYITPPELLPGEKLIGSGKSLNEYTFVQCMEWCWRAYKTLLERGIPREIARYVLPNACETQIVMTMNFRELRHFIRLRTSQRALPEMRCMAGKIRDICKEIAPKVFEDV